MKGVVVQIAAIFKALADASRIRALAALHDQALCACQVVELLGLAPSTVSKHMAVLVQAGLVVTTKKGRWVYYRQADDAGAQVQQLLRLLPDLLQHESQTQQDRAALAQILTMDPEALCRLQSTRAGCE